MGSWYSKWGLLAVLLLAASPTQTWAQSGQEYAREAGGRLEGRAIPPLRLTTIDGKMLDVGALRGRKAVYLKFWATWCVPCRQQMPHFENVQRTAGDDLAVVAINIGFDDTREQIDAFRIEHGLTMPMVRDDDGRLGELFGVRVTPQHVVIGKDGRIAYVGHFADAALDGALASARNATPAAPAAAMIAPNTAVRTLRERDAVPTVEVKTLEGISLPLSDPERKRGTVLAFISPWCESYLEKTRPQSSRQCIDLREQLVALGQDRSVRWLGIASGLWASDVDLRKYRDEHRIPVPLSLDKDGTLFRRFGIRKVPAVVLVDADGRVRQRLEPGASGVYDLKQVLTPSRP